MDDKRIKLLAEAPVSEGINKMAAPAIVGLLVMAIYNMVDTMFVAWLGAEPIAATQTGMPLIMVTSAIGLTFGIGGGNYLSRLLGSKELERAKQLNSVVFFSGLALGVILIGLMLLFINPLLSFFGATPEILDLAREYGIPITTGGLFLIGSMLLNNLLRSEGSSKYSMIGMAAGSLLNIILDPLLIFTLNMGVRGAAIATAFSQAVSFFILLSMYLRKKALVPILWRYFKPEADMYREILKIGIPTFARQILFSLSMAFINQAAGKYGGTSLLAAMGLVLKIMMVPFNIIFGLGQGYQPVAGYNVGAGQHERVRSSLFYATGISAVISLGAGMLFFFFPHTILSIFKPSAEVAELAVKGMMIYALGTPFFGVGNTISIYFQASGKGSISFLLSTARQGIFFLPLLLILPPLLGAEGVMSIQTTADVLSFIFSLLFLIPALNRLNRRIKGTIHA